MSLNDILRCRSGVPVGSRCSVPILVNEQQNTDQDFVAFSCDHMFHFSFITIGISSVFGK